MMNLKRLQEVVDSLKAAVGELELLASETDDMKADNKPTEPTTKKEETKVATPTEDLPWEEKTLTFEEVRKILVQKSRSGFSAKIKELIIKHGAEKLSDIKPSEYAALVAEAEVLGR